MKENPNSMIDFYINIYWVSCPLHLDKQADKYHPISYAVSCLDCKI